MARKSDGRSADVRALLPKSYKGQGTRGEAGIGPVPLRDPHTGFYSRAALTEFIQYDIDGAAQMMLNESWVTPLCLAAVSFELGKAGKDQDPALIVSEAVRKLTRVADRGAQDGDRYLLLLRRTLAANVRDHFAPRLVETVGDALKDTGASFTLSMGIASLVEHTVRDPDDMIRKALRALEEAEKKPGSFVVYDFRVMPLA